MNWENFFAMGGYAAYVWPAYGITAAVLIATYVWPVLQRKQLLRQIALRQKRAQR